MGKRQWTVCRLDYVVKNASGKGPVIYGFGIMDPDKWGMGIRVVETLLRGAVDHWPNLGRLYQLRGDGNEGLEIREYQK